MRVFILAGGLGTRIRSLFPDCPKPMVPIAGKPFLEWQIELLQSQGFSDFVLCVGYLSQQISDYFGDGSRWGIRIQYSIETTALGTAGALKNAAPYFDQTSIILNGDTYLAIDYHNLIARHQTQVNQAKTIGGLSLVRMENATRFGRVLLNNKQNIIEFQEKSQVVEEGLINAGAYVFNPHLLDFIPTEQFVSLEKDTFPKLVKAEAGLFGWLFTDSFIDMGTPEGYNQLSGLLKN